MVHGVSGDFYRFKAMADAVSLYLIKVFINYYYIQLENNKRALLKAFFRVCWWRGGGSAFRYVNACLSFGRERSGWGREPKNPNLYRGRTNPHHPTADSVERSK